MSVSVPNLSQEGEAHKPMNPVEKEHFIHQ